MQRLAITCRSLLISLSSFTDIISECVWPFKLILYITRRLGRVYQIPVEARRSTHPLFPPMHKASAIHNHYNSHEVAFQGAWSSPNILPSKNSKKYEQVYERMTCFENHADKDFVVERFTRWCPDKLCGLVSLSKGVCIISALCHRQAFEKEF